jgi:uncharacterized membrane protein
LERLSRLIDSSKPDAFIGVISKAWSFIGWVLLALTLVALIITVFKRVITETPIILGLISLVVFARVGLFGILDSSSWYGLASRYMFPAVPFFITAVVLGLALFVQLIQKRGGGL